MALFKISKGNSSNLSSQTLTEGFCWFTPDDGKFYIDATKDSVLTRIPLNAKKADTADAWTTGQKVYVNLGSADKTKTISGGSATAQEIGVDGTLSIANGGTGATNAIDALNNLVGTNAIGSSTSPIYWTGSAFSSITGTIGSSTKPVYINAGVITAGSTYAGGTKVTLNGTAKGASTASFYAPTTAGTSGYILKSNGSGAPTWLQTLPIANGGTGANNAIDAKTNLGLSNVSNDANLNSSAGAKGDIIYWSATDTPAHLTNTSSSTKKFLSITSQVPSWSAVSQSDVGLSNVENVALSTWAGSENITTLGTITTGTWEGDIVSITHGGTGAQNAVDAIQNLMGSTAVGSNKKPIYWSGSAFSTMTTVGSSTVPIYFNSNGEITSCSTYAGGTKVTLNGSNKGASTASFYAPTGVGTSGYILTSAGSGAPSWQETVPISHGGTGATNATDARINLGLSTALRFIGKATVDIVDGSTTDPVITGYSFGTNGASAQAGDVIIDANNSYEYVWTLAGAWERLGPDGSYKTIQTAITAPTAVTNTWISSIGQDANGVISPSYTALDTSGDWTGNAGNVTGIVGLSHGGTGAQNAIDALNNLMGTSAIGSNTKPIYWTGSAFSTMTTVGSTTAPIYFDSNGQITAGSTYAGGTKVTLNGTAKGASTASFYAPTAVGTSGQILTSAGSGAPTWKTLSMTVTSENLIITLA